MQLKSTYKKTIPLNELKSGMAPVNWFLERSNDFNEGMLDSNAASSSPESRFPLALLQNYAQKINGPSFIHTEVASTHFY
jgi:hypothetical protein